MRREFGRNRTIFSGDKATRVRGDGEVSERTRSTSARVAEERPTRWWYTGGFVKPGLRGTKGNPILLVSHQCSLPKFGASLPNQTTSRPRTKAKVTATHAATPLLRCAQIFARCASARSEKLLRGESHTGKVTTARHPLRTRACAAMQWHGLDTQSRQWTLGSARGDAQREFGEGSGRSLTSACLRTRCCQ